MRTSLASALSVLGVLTAGAAAFAVNTAVLQPSAQPAAVATDAPQVSTTLNDVRRQSETPAPTNPVVAVAQQPSQTSTYKVGEAGRVILEVVDGRLQVANVLPATGWTSRAPDYDDGEVEVKFTKANVELEFKARLVNGDIRVFVESENEEYDSSTEREYHDDDDDDDHDRSDHEDEHDDEDDD